MNSLPNLNELSHAQKDDLIRMLWPLQQQVQDLMTQMGVMQERIKQLEGRLASTSRNSSKPPSSDGYAKPSPKSLRIAGQKPTGGQKGHPGNTLRQSASVDQTTCHCSACRLELREHTVAETRQVFELPTLAMRTVAHQQMRSVCACGAVHLAV
jgi:transposase